MAVEVEEGKAGPDVPAMGLKARLEAYERQLIESALAAAGGHQRRAAAALGVLPTTLNEKLKRLGLRTSREAASPPDPSTEAVGEERSRS
jgi:DNA-binding NtrC family response regulator